MEDSTDELIFQSGPPNLTLIKVYKSGRVERFHDDTSTPGTDTIHGVASKDVNINDDVSVRIYRPKEATNSNEKIPIIVHFHGGGFCIGRASNPTFHKFLNSIVERANLVAVTVEYRLAPENPIPAAYEDSWAALRWVAAGADDWIADQGDLNRIFVAGESAGANIAHQMAMRAGRESVGRGFFGMLLIHPFFLGSLSVESESMDPSIVSNLVDTWNLVCPSSPGVTADPRINPSIDVDLAFLGCARALVCVATDPLRDRGKEYCNALRASGWRGELVEYEAVGLGHTEHLFRPNCEEALAQEKVILEFLKKR